MPKEFPPQYNPHEHEKKIYDLWEQSGFFDPDVCVEKGITKKTAKAFSVALPPPNVTGALHLGHAFEHALQDIMVRYRRMKGFRTLWVPGTDHAAIATQAKYERELYKKEKKSRHDFSREEFVARVQSFALENQHKILSQLKLLGDSLDWSRLAFTLDDARAKAVFVAFKKMYDDGLIYRGYRIVNWDPKGQTTISDDEVVHEETAGTLYTFRYSADFPIPIATTRPETKVGDVAVAVHPTDKRYKEYIGKEYKVDFVGTSLEIKIVGDKEVDPAYGTGAVGVTPAHSQTDWDIAERHKLPFKKVINEYAKMESVGEELAGKKTSEARGIIVEKLRVAGLLIKEEKTSMNIAKAERTGGVVEPLPKEQWFVAVDRPFGKSKKTLKGIMRDSVKSGKVKIMPDQFRKRYDHWVGNLRDWCISRQILYGHRIPAWFHEPKCVPKKGHEGDVVKCKHIIVSETKPTCEFCDAEFVQDPDTLDTWFSSALWTFSTLGFPEKTADLKTYHPTSVINPGYEILFLWVSRMIMMSGYLLGEAPFRLAYIHGIVRDKDGNKFSKSAGNAPDPADIIDAHGADALRMSLIIGVGAGADSKFDVNKVKAYQHFANKLWNITRFIVMKGAEIDTKKKPSLTARDKAYLKELGALKKDISKDMEAYRFHRAGEKLYHYIWHTFADKIVEETKPRLEAGGKDAEAATHTLHAILESSLKMLHPFMPFVTEAIWQKIYEGKRFLMVEKW